MRSLKNFGEALWNAKDADLYVDAKGGYPLAFNGSFRGSYVPLKFEGDFDVQIELTGINQDTSVKLLASCNKPIVPLVYKWIEPHRATNHNCLPVWS